MKNYFSYIFNTLLVYYLSIILFINKMIYYLLIIKKLLSNLLFNNGHLKVKFEKSNTFKSYYYFKFWKGLYNFLAL